MKITSTGKFLLSAPFLSLELFLRMTIYIGLGGLEEQEIGGQPTL